MTGVPPAVELSRRCGFGRARERREAVHLDPAPGVLQGPDVVYRTQVSFEEPKHLNFVPLFRSQEVELCLADGLSPRGHSRLDHLAATPGGVLARLHT